MDLLNRRDFLSRTAAAVGASILVGPPAVSRAASPPATRPASGSILRATDQILLGKTGIKASRLSIGTGTNGGREQRSAGAPAMIKLLRGALDDGIRWWDAADSYKSHPYVALALKEVKREQVTLTTKTWSKTPDRVRADIERFRKELGTDYLDIVLLHCMTDSDWPRKLRGAMDALSEAKEKGWVRAVGCSCHTFGALKAAADEPWVEVDLARINPFATLMDVERPAEVSKVEEVLKTMHERGKAVYGMKILGEGRLKGDQIDKSLAFVLNKPYISGFTIGFSDKSQIDDVARRIERIRAKA
jgi:aryl-alcohol dehydrogenase-like predicted oxidoreductase